MKLCTMLLAALLAAAALAAHAQEAPVAAAAAAKRSGGILTPKTRIISLIDGGLHGYNRTAVATGTCLVTARSAGPNADAVGTAMANLLDTDAPVIAWEQDGALHAALIFNNFTTHAPLAAAREACRTVQARLPSKLRKGASVETAAFGYVFDPRKPGKKGPCSWLCNRYCKKNDWRCKGLCFLAGWGCKGICSMIGLPWIICKWL